MTAPTVNELVRLGHSELLATYGHRLTLVQRNALRAMARCRTATQGTTLMHCDNCDHLEPRLRSCRNRACPQCLHHAAVQWLERQLAKQLPVRYFMITFTVPSALRAVFYRTQADAFNALFRAAVDTLHTFGKNDPQLNARLGVCAVLHTHNRRLDFHPHVHAIVPAATIDTQRRQWRKHSGRYLFNGKALGRVFRAKLLDALNRAAVGLPNGMPEHWVVHCENVGFGHGALVYLSRYLYRGVISNRDILSFADGNVTFEYTDAKTRRRATRSLPLVEFLWRLMVHVLPKGFQRARNYGFLHGNAKQLLALVQRLLRVAIDPNAARQSTVFTCPRCHRPMTPTDGSMTWDSG